MRNCEVTAELSYKICWLFSHSDDYDGDYDDEEAAEEGDDDESEDDDEENVSESEAGIDDSGYDEADAANYENPEGYTYGSGNEYDF